MGRTERLARVCGSHPWRTILAWVGVIVLAVVAAAVFLPGNLTSTGHVTGNPESKQAEDLLFGHFPPDPNAADELVVVRSPTHTVDDPRFDEFVTSLYNQARPTGVVYRARSYLDTPGLVSADRHAALIEIQRQKDVDDLLPVIERNDSREGFRVTITGSGTLDHDFNDLSQHDLKSGELQVGLPAALVVLVLVFGAVVAGLVPLLMALVSILVAIGLTALVAEGFTLSIFVINMLTGMGLALGIDYSLFVVSRYREERGRGREQLDAIAASGATASRAVLFSGSVFVIALTGMFLVASNVMRSLAVGAILVGIASVLAALTLLPALLGLLGDRVNALRVPLVGRSVGHEAQEGRFWGAIVHGVMRRPVLSLPLGANGVSTLPNRLASKQGYEALARSFPQASAAPVLVAIQGDVTSPGARAAIGRLRSQIAADRAFGGRGDLRLSSDRDLAALIVPLRGDKTGDAALDAVRRLRDTAIPQALGDSGLHAVVGGDTADNVDFIDAV